MSNCVWPSERVPTERCRMNVVCVCVCVCGRHFQQIGHQPGVVANGQLNKENRIFPVPVRA